MLEYWAAVCTDRGLAVVCEPLTHERAYVRDLQAVAPTCRPSDAATGQECEAACLSPQEVAKCPVDGLVHNILVEARRVRYVKCTA